MRKISQYYKKIKIHSSDLLQKFSRFSKIRQAIVLLVVLIAIPVTVYLSQQVVRYVTRAGQDEALFFYSPDSLELNPTNTLQVWLDSSNDIGFIRVEMTFDSTLINLDEEINITGPGLTIVVESTSRSEANETGKAVIAVGVPVDSTSPTGVFEVARLPFRAATSQNNVTTEVDFNIEGSQVVDDQENVMTLSKQSATLTLNPLSPESTQTPTPISSPSNVSVTNLQVESGEPYELDTANEDIRVYIDRRYLISNLSSSLLGDVYIRTANNDKKSSGTSFLRFDVDRDVNVYVAWDIRASEYPSWLSDWIDTGIVLDTTDVEHKVFSKQFNSGTVTLGGNQPSDARSMYMVFIEGIESEDVSPTPTLTPSPTPTPVDEENLTVSDVQAASGKQYQVDSFVSGTLVYIDRRYTVVDSPDSPLPSSLVEDVYIRTANDDKNSSGDNFLTFDVSRPVTVYVLFDIRATSLPTWMGDWEDTGRYVSTTDVDHKVFMKNFDSGSITLGGNSTPGARSMYMVVVE